MVGAPQHVELSGPLMKRGKLRKWQLRWFYLQTHYLTYKLKNTDAAFAGGVDLRGPASKISLLRNGKVMRVVGLDADVSNPSKERELRSFVLKATNKTGATSLETW